MLILTHEGPHMAEQIKIIETELRRYQFGLENGLITQSEYDELTLCVVHKLKLLANKR